MAGTDPTSHELGVTIRILRTERGWSLEDLARYAGIHVSYLSGIELRKRNPSWETVRKIAAAFGMNVCQLAGEASGSEE